jgi:hypothetical protein
MESNQNIGDVTNSTLQGVNVNTQIETSLKEQTDRIDELKNNILPPLNERLSEIEKLKTKWFASKKEKYFTIFYWVSGFSFLLSIIAICGAFICKNTVIVEESIVLTFVGILATFVVVSNYSQVHSIENKVNSYINSIQSIKDDLINSQVGLCMLRAESLIDSNPIGTIYFYLYAIKIGLDSPPECDNLFDCVKSIKDVRTNGVNGTNSYRDIINSNKKYSYKINGEKVDDLIENILSNKNYNIIKREFDKLIN